STNRLDRERIRGAVEQAIAITRLTGRDDELQRLAEPAAYQEVNRWFESTARFSITAMAGDSSGWAKAGACDLCDLNPLELARTAARKASQSGAPRELPSGRYTVILEPAAVLDLAGQMFADFSATALRDGRSFLNDRIGKKVFG